MSDTHGRTSPEPGYESDGLNSEAGWATGRRSSVGGLASHGKLDDALGPGVWETKTENGWVKYRPLDVGPWLPLYPAEPGEEASSPGSERGADISRSASPKLESEWEREATELAEELDTILGPVPEDWLDHALKQECGTESNLEVSQPGVDTTCGQHGKDNGDGSHLTHGGRYFPDNGTAKTSASMGSGAEVDDSFWENAMRGDHFSDLDELIAANDRELREYYDQLPTEEAKSRWISEMRSGGSDQEIGRIFGLPDGTSIDMLSGRSLDDKADSSIKDNEDQTASGAQISDLIAASI